MLTINRTNRPSAGSPSNSRIRSTLLIGLTLIFGLLVRAPVEAATAVLLPIDQGAIELTRVGRTNQVERIVHDASASVVRISNATSVFLPSSATFRTQQSAGYLVFAVPDLTGNAVASATLKLEWTGEIYDYNVNGVGSDPALLQVDYNESASLFVFGPSKDLFNDLTGGPAYGSSTTAGSDSLNLNDTAIAEINAGSGNSFIVSLFGGNDESFDYATLSSSQLHLVTVPEPTSLGSLLVTLAWIVRRNRAAV